MFAKVRPVGSPVPRPGDAEALSLPWEGHYTALFTGSGTEALSMAVEAAVTAKPDVDLPEVIIPAYGCPDLVAAIMAQNAWPILVDFTNSSPVMDEESIARALNKHTVAIVAVNFLGSYERLSQLAELCSDSGVVLIEDSAQCFPPSSSSHGLADYVVLSFGRGKPINLMGGGALLIRHAKQSVVQSLRSEYPCLAVRLDVVWHFKRLVFNLLLSRYAYPVLEHVSFLHVGETRFHPLETIRTLEFPSSLLSAAINAYYEREPLHLVYSSKLAFLKDAGWKLIGVNSANDRLPRLRYALLAPQESIRNQVVKELNDRGIGANAFYGSILPEIIDASALGIVLSGTYPNATDFASRLVTLPTHEGVERKDLETIISVFEGYLSSSNIK